jgi:predicted  nucleic acid-binding Zn-ribbon protein
MAKLTEMYETCKQCGFDYARIDTERWNESSARRVMCPVCGWTKFEEHHWKDEETSVLVKRNESHGFGAYRLVPPGGYSGYNAFHSVPDEDVIDNIRDLITCKGWKGYLTIWDDTTDRARLIAGSPLQKYDTIGRE